MFTNIFYIILLLLIISLSPSGGPSPLSPLNAFFVSMIIYLGVICLIIWQNWRFKKTLRLKKGLMLGLVNFELLLFFITYHFILKGDRVLSIPYFPATLITFFSLFLYFSALGIFHFTAFRQRKITLPDETPFAHAQDQIRFLIPFILPFLLLTFFLELLNCFSLLDEIQNMENGWSTLITIVMTIGLMLILLLILPPIIQWIWQCKTLESSPLEERLRGLCERAGFKNPKLKVWTVMNQALTAAIVGIAAPFRYVIFTKRLLNEISPDALEAILAHEIGHSKRKHLFLYPFILMGFVVLSGILTFLLTPIMEDTLKAYPSTDWETILPIAFFVVYGILIISYLRFVFGFFSRLFERQADLHVFELSVPPEHMIKALDELGIATGHTHNYPSWHHYSIQQRIDYIASAIKNPSLIQKHHQKVKKVLIAYFSLLFFGILVLISPWMPSVFPFNYIQQGLSKISSV